MENINDFIGIAIVGSALSLGIEYLKAKIEPTSFGARIITIGFALMIGGIYYALANTVLWQTILGVLASASTFYAIFLKK